ncbi:hypothetical protein ACLBVW_37995, partial [Pseudomonas aeruginosa]
YRSSWVISQKTFHKVLRRLLPFYKTSRRKAQEEDDKAISEMYEAELDRDLSETYGETEGTWCGTPY